MSFLFNSVVNDWGETTYKPTTAGYVLLIVVIGVMLIAAAALASKALKSVGKSTPSPLNARQLAFCAICIALGTVTSFIKIFHFPFGGSITLFSMLFICLPGYFYGFGPGLLAAVSYGMLQMLIDPYILYPSQAIVDYILAFGALGLSGLFCNAKNGLLKGYLVGITGRWFFAFLSGWIFFGMYAWEGWNPVAYSIVYNLIYIGAEGALTVIIQFIPAVKKAFTMAKLSANGVNV